jgi:protein TonB
LRYLKPRTTIPQAEPKPENIIKVPKNIPTKQIWKSVEPILPQKIKKSIQYRITTPQKNVKPTPRKVMPKPVQPSEGMKPPLPPEPNLSEFEPHSERSEPRTAEENLQFSDVATEQKISKAIPPSSPIPAKEAIPLYRVNPPPKYPGLARRRGYQGTVIMDVLVDPKGKVKELRLSQSSGYPLLDRAAMKSVKSWEFEPGRRGDEAVEMWVKIPVRFQLK